MPSVAHILVSVVSHNSAGGTDDQREYVLHLGREPQTFEVELDTDDPVAVQFNGMDEAVLIKVESLDGKVRARFTSADGANAEMPVDPVLAVVSKSVPFTALDLTRVAGAPTVLVRVTLGAPEA